MGSSIAGGGSDTEVGSRKVAGVVVDSSGTPVSGAIVRLRPSNYIADSLVDSGYVQSHSLMDMVAGADGSFTFDSVRPDTYCIDISHNDSIGVLCSFQVMQSDSMVQLPTVVASELSFVDGSVKIYGNDSSVCYLQVYGTDYTAQPDPSGYFMMKIPSGKHTLYFGAYEKGDSLRAASVDKVDLSFEVEEKYHRVGEIYLKSPGLDQCGDFPCDSIIMRAALDEMGLVDIDVRTVCEIQNNRIVGIILRGFTIGKISIEVKKLSELRTLDLGVTGIETVLPDVGTITKLEILRLDSNRLTFLPSSVAYMQNLRVLDVRNNKISTLPADISGLKPSVLLDLSGNRLCDPVGMSSDTLAAQWADQYDPDWRQLQVCQ